MQFSSALVSEMRDAGATVCAWTFASGGNPASEAAAAIAAVHEGAQCLVVDAENQYDGRYGAAQSFVRALRTGVGSAFPIGLASEAEVLQHPRFPYSVFLGPGGFDVVLPQIYWLDFGVSGTGSCDVESLVAPSSAGAVLGERITRQRAMTRDALRVERPSQRRSTAIDHPSSSA